VIAYNSFYNESSLGIAGRFFSGNYLSFAQTNMYKNGDKQALGAINGSHRLLTGVKSFEGLFVCLLILLSYFFFFVFVGGFYSYRSVVSLSSGATNVAQWSDGLPLVAVKGHVVW
jgi:hypothetical protein